jgi:HAE1 family hydrophobic/amphiphilic exporter-1
MSTHSRNSAFFGALVRRPVMLFTLCLTLVVIGIVTWVRIPVQMMPDGIVEPGLQVFVQNIGASAPENEEQVARVLEEELRTIQGIQDIDSSARQDSVMASVHFQATTDMNLAKAEVRDRVERARPKFPRTVSEISIWSWSESDMPVMFFALMHPGDSPRTDFLVKEVIQRRLEAVDGVGKVDVWGLLDDSRRILLDEQKVKAAHLDLGALIRRLSSDNFALPMGEIEDGGRRILLRADMRFRSIEEIEGYPIGNGLKLGDIAHVEDVKTVRDSLFRIDGRYAYFGQIQKDGQANVVETCKRLQKELAELEQDPQLGGEFQFLPIFDQGQFISTSLGQLENTAIEGGLLAVVILFIFLWRVRLTLLVATAIPLSVLFALAWIYFRGGSFNVLTMTGFTLALGMLVDDAIVVIENITRLRAQGASKREAVVRGTGDVALAVGLSTLTTVVVFMPLMFMSENPTVKILFGELGLPLCISMLFSLVVSMVFLPVAAEPLLEAHKIGAGRVARALQPLVELPGRALELVLRGLRASAHALLRALHPLQRGMLRLLTPLRWLVAAGALLLALWVARHYLGLARATTDVDAFGQGLPSAARLLPGLLVFGALVAALLALCGLPRWRARAAAAPAPPAASPRHFRSVIDAVVAGNGALLAWSLRHRVAASLLSLLCVFSVVVPVQHMQVAAFGEDDNRTRFVFQVVLEDNFTLAQASDEMQRYETLIEPRRADYGFDHLAARFSRSGGQIRLFFDHPQSKQHFDRLSKELQHGLPRFPGHKLVFTDSEAGSSGAASRLTSEVSFLLQGPSSEELARLAPQAIALLKAVPGLSSVSPPLENERRQVRLKLDQEIAQKLGIDSQTALQNVAWALRGFQLAPYQEPGREVPLIIEYDGTADAGLSTLRRMEIRSGNSTVPLTSIATLGFEDGQRTIYRHNGQSTLTLRAKLDNPANAQEAYKGGLRALEGLDLPRGFSVAREDSLLQRQDEELSAIKSAALLAFGLVFIVMAITFESLALPCAIIFTVPLYAGIGAYWTLYLTGTAMNSVGWIGIIILIGVAVRNGVVLIDRIQQIREEHPGMARTAAVIEGAHNRVRPILMTTLTAVLGLIPMALTEPPGESIDYRALATCIAGGLTVSAVLTLWVVPLVYTLLDDLSIAFSKMLRWSLRRKDTPIRDPAQGEFSSAAGLGDEGR